MFSSMIVDGQYTFALDFWLIAYFQQSSFALVQAFHNHRFSGRSSRTEERTHRGAKNFWEKSVAYRHHGLIASDRKLASLRRKVVDKF